MKTLFFLFHTVYIVKNKNLNQNMIFENVKRLYIPTSYIKE